MKRLKVSILGVKESSLISQQILEIIKFIIFSQLNILLGCQLLSPSLTLISHLLAQLKIAHFKARKLQS